MCIYSRNVCSWQPPWFFCDEGMIGWTPCDGKETDHPIATLVAIRFDRVSNSMQRVWSHWQVRRYLRKSHLYIYYNRDTSIGLIESLEARLKTAKSRNMCHESPRQRKRVVRRTRGVRSSLAEWASTYTIHRACTAIHNSGSFFFKIPTYVAHKDLPGITPQLYILWRTCATCHSTSVVNHPVLEILGAVKVLSVRQLDWIVVLRDPGTWPRDSAS